WTLALSLLVSLPSRLLKTSSEGVSRGVSLPMGGKVTGPDLEGKENRSRVRLRGRLFNLTYQDGQLQVSQAGKYYVYAQIYFRYPTEGADARSLGHQLVQCINLQSVYGQTILLLKGVGTKCWQQDAAYGLHALYQGGLFDLKAGDKLFVSVSSLDVNYDDEAGSYFGAFRLDV
uniref:THD domain-containing protein n=1 Tax=Naja naja TaxID=35670 RepID=A0A8C6XSR7_NAJNA